MKLVVKETLGKFSLLILILGISVGFLIYQPSFIVRLNEVPWLALGLTTLAFGLSIQYGQSKLALTSFILGVLQSIPLFISSLTDTVLYKEVVPTCVIATVTYLMWMKDRSFTRYSLFHFFFVVFAVCLIVVILNIVFSAFDINDWYKDTKLQTSSLLVMTLSVIAALIKLMIKPTNGHLSLAVTVIVISLIVFFLGTMEDSLSYAILPVLFIGGLIADSHSMAYRDQLTGIKSRRALEQAATGLGNQYAVVMCDVDHFKKFNDTYGHDVGDQVLRLVAKKLNQVEGGGKAYRYGGEEFTLLFAGKTADQVSSFVEKVRQAIETYKIAIRDHNRDQQSKKHRSGKPAQKTVSVTMSFGIAHLNGGAQPFEDIVKMADKALYKSKKAGRNCVSIAA